MNKKQKLFFILGVISFLIGGTMVFICSLNEKLGIPLTITERIVVGIVGILFIIGAIACLILYINNFFNNDEDAKIEENDERNIMIRGKVAEKSLLVTTLVMVIVEFILICIGYVTPALLVGLAMFLCFFVEMLLFIYYQKKY